MASMLKVKIMCDSKDEFSRRQRNILIYLFRRVPSNPFNLQQPPTMSSHIRSNTHTKTSTQPQESTMLPTTHATHSQCALYCYILHKLCNVNLTMCTPHPYLNHEIFAILFIYYFWHGSCCINNDEQYAHFYLLRNKFENFRKISQGVSTYSTSGLWKPCTNLCLFRGIQICVIPLRVTVNAHSNNVEHFPKNLMTTHMLKFPRMRMNVSILCDFEKLSTVTTSCIAACLCLRVS